MSPFMALMLAHLVGDWMIQTEYQALNKAKGHWCNDALCAHCIGYTLCFVPVFLLYSLNWWWLALIFGSHMFLDRRWPVIWWIRVVKRTSDETISKLFWLVVAVDQIMHLLILVPIALFN